MTLYVHTCFHNASYIRFFLPSYILLKNTEIILASSKMSTYHSNNRFFPKSWEKMCEFRLGIGKILEKLCSGLWSLVNFPLVHIQALLLQLKKHFIPFLITLPNLIPYLLQSKSSIIYSTFPHSQKENNHIQGQLRTHREHTERGLDSIPTRNFWAHLLFSLRINAVSNPSSRQGMNITIEGVIASVFTTWFSRTLCCSDMASQSHSAGELHWGLITIHAIGVKFQHSGLSTPKHMGGPPSYPTTPR